ncbi:MAG TPA: tape measure protein [Tepidisphaeraceae bacterium]|nr:tape measure protein [Tepidisphaeraceae bacterium]
MMGGLSLGAGGLTAGLGMLGPMGAGLAGGIMGGFSITSFLTDSIKIAAEMEDVAASFQTMLGDAATGEALFKEIESASDDMRMNIRATSEAAKDLFSADLEADQIVPALRMLGDLAMGNEEKLKGLASAYGRVIDTGEVGGKTLKAFAAQGVFLTGDLAKQLGVSTTELKFMLEEGRVSVKDFQQALITATSEGGKFFGATERRAQTLAGRFDMLKNAWDDFRWDLGQMIIDEFGLKDFVTNLTDSLRFGQDNLEAIRPLVKEIAAAFKEAGKAAFQMGMTMVRTLAQTMDMLDELGRTGEGDSHFSLTGAARDQVRAWSWVNRQLGGGKESENAGTWEKNFGLFEAQMRKIFDIEAPQASYLDKVWDMFGRAGKEAEKMANEFKLASDKLRAADIKRVEDINSRFDVVGALKKDVLDLAAVAGRGGFFRQGGADLLEFQIGEMFKQAEGAMGAGRPQLAGAALKDSAEAVSAITQQNVGRENAQERVANFLAAANEQRKILLDVNREIARELQKKGFLIDDKNMPE